jgi:crossover junction endodeoxyribonuclease RuvC
MDIIRSHQPDEAAVEETFVNSDAKATLKLGQARGVLMLAPAMLKIPVSEYAPNMVKKTVVGTGHADKDQVKHMVKLLLPKAMMKSADSTDALAIAICHAHHRAHQTLAKILARS